MMRINNVRLVMTGATIDPRLFNGHFVPDNAYPEGCDESQQRLKLSEPPHDTDLHTVIGTAVRQADKGVGDDHIVQ